MASVSRATTRLFRSNLILQGKHCLFLCTEKTTGFLNDCNNRPILLVSPSSLQAMFSDTATARCDLPDGHICYHADQDYCCF